MIDALTLEMGELLAWALSERERLGGSEAREAARARELLEYQARDLAAFEAYMEANYQADPEWWDQRDHEEGE